MVVCRVCVVPGCTNRQNYNDNDNVVDVEDHDIVPTISLTFHKFPLSEPDRCAEWVRLVARVRLNGDPWRPSQSSRICSDHFMKNDFVVFTARNRHLKSTAIPSRFQCRLSASANVPSTGHLLHPQQNQLPKAEPSQSHLVHPQQDQPMPEPASFLVYHQQPSLDTSQAPSIVVVVQDAQPGPETSTTTSLFENPQVTQLTTAPSTSTTNPQVYQQHGEHTDWQHQQQERHVPVLPTAVRFAGKERKKKKKKLSKNVKSKENLDHCAASNCQNSKMKNPLLQFYKFPKDPDRCHDWAVGVGREDLLHVSATSLHAKRTVCACHFDVSQFRKGTKKLVEWATPSLYNPSAGLHKENISARPSTVQYRQLPDHDTPMKQGSKSTFHCDDPQLSQLLSCVARVDCANCSKDIWISCQPEGHVMIVLGQKDQNQKWLMENNLLSRPKPNWDNSLNRQTTGLSQQNTQRLISNHNTTLAHTQDNMETAIVIKEGLTSATIDKEVTLDSVGTGAEFTVTVAKVEQLAADEERITVPWSAAKPLSVFSLDEDLFTATSDMNLSGGVVAESITVGDTLEIHDVNGEVKTLDIAIKPGITQTLEIDLPVVSTSNADLTIVGPGGSTSADFSNVIEQACTLVEQVAVQEQGGVIVEPGISVSQASSVLVDSGQKEARVKKAVEELCAENPELLTLYSELSHMGPDGNSVLQLRLQPSHSTNASVQQGPVSNLTMPMYKHKAVGVPVVRSLTDPPPPKRQRKDNGRYYRCELCNKNLKGREGVYEHIQNHYLPRSFVCTICGKAFTRRYKMVAHIRGSHEKIKNFQCDICGKRFMHQSVLKTHHRATHLKIRQAVCHLCGMEFTQKQNLRRHLLMHTGEKRFSCDYCGRRFFQNSARMAHERTHTGEKAWCCEVCGRGFQAPGVLKKHLEQHAAGTINDKGSHGSDVPGETCKCDICGLSFLGRFGLSQHKKVHQEPKCDICGLLLTDRDAVALHKESVHDVVLFKCTTCGKGFETSSLLTYHRQSAHAPKRQVTCEVCNRTFSSRQAKIYHVQTHTGVKPYPCDICGRRFGNIGNRARHQRIHTGEKPYKCYICGRDFSQSSAMKEHRKIHDKKKNQHSSTLSS